MAADRILALKLVTDVGDINKQVKGVSGTFANMANAAKSWGKAFTTGLVLDGIDKVGQSLQEAWAGYRTGEKLAAQLGTTWKNLGLDGSRLSTTLQAVRDSTLAIGTSDDEAVKAFTNVLKTTGSVSESMKRLQIAQDLVANGSAPDLESAMTIIRQASKGSARAVDKFGLTSKTAAGRVTELGNKVKGAAAKAALLDPLAVVTNRIREHLESAVGAFAQGDLNGSLKALAGIGTDLSTAWSGLFPSVSGVADKLTGGAFSGAAKALGDLSDKVSTALVPAFAAFNTLMSALVPILQQVQAIVQPLADAFSATVDGGLAMVATGAQTVFQTFADLLKGDFTGALNTVVGGVQNLAHEFGSSFGKIQAIVGSVISNIISAWNSLDFTIPAGSFQFTPGVDIPNPLGGYFHIPAVGFSWAGSGDLIPDIGNSHAGNRGMFGRGRSSGDLSGNGGADGSHRGGLDRVPFDGYMAQLHRNEAVLTAGEAQQWRGGGGGSTYNITVNAGVGDPVSIGQQVVNVIRAYEKRASANWRR